LKPGRLLQGEIIEDDQRAIDWLLSGPEEQPSGYEGGTHRQGEGMGERGGGRGGDGTMGLRDGGGHRRGGW
jgi:hypothetical protein